MTPEWQETIKILGDAVFKHVFKECIILQRTNDGSLVQIAGTNLKFFTRKGYYD